MVIIPKKIIKLARKWQQIAALRRKRISLPELNISVAAVADKGHFVFYTNDQRRFVFPNLSNSIFQELLRMSAEEFGLPSNGPIMLPCDAMFMENAVFFIQNCVDSHLQEALLMSVASSRCSLCLEQTTQPLLVCQLLS